MWTTVIAGISGVIESWFKKKQRQQELESQYKEKALQGEIDYDLYAMQQKQHTILDDIIGIVFVSPFVVAWFDEQKAMAWVGFVSAIPLYYWIVFSGIVASTFGLRWWFKNKEINKR